jgi:hypothetical protein
VLLERIAESALTVICHNQPEGIMILALNRGRHENHRRDRRQAWSPARRTLPHYYGRRDSRGPGTQHNLPHGNCVCRYGAEDRLTQHKRRGGCKLGGGSRAMGRTAGRRGRCGGKRMLGESARGHCRRGLLEKL